MSDQFNESMRTELFAASLRADQTDLKTFLDALAVKLEGSLPDYTRVVRQGGIFSRERRVKEIVVAIAEFHYRIGREKQGLLIAERWHVVRGIVLKTEQIPVEQWIEELSEAMSQLAGQSAQARVALEHFLLQ